MTAHESGTTIGGYTTTGDAGSTGIKVYGTITPFFTSITIEEPLTPIRVPSAISLLDPTEETPTLSIHLLAEDL